MYVDCKKTTVGISVYLALGEGELRQQDGRYECKMSVHDKRDRVITCEFGGDLHLTLLLAGDLKKVCVKFNLLSLLNGSWAPDSPD